MDIEEYENKLLAFTDRVIARLMRLYGRRDQPSLDVIVPPSPYVDLESRIERLCDLEADTAASFASPIGVSDPALFEQVYAQERQWQRDVYDEIFTSPTFWREETEEGLFENPELPLTRKERAELLSRLYSRRIDPVELVTEYWLPYADKKLFNLFLAKFILDQEEARGEPLPPIFYEAYEQAVEWFPDDPFEFSELNKVRSFYMKQMTDLIPDYAYDYKRQTLFYAMLAVRNGTMFYVLLGLGNVPFFVGRYLESRALMEGVSKYDLEKIREQEKQRQIDLMIAILEDRPIQEAMEAWREEAEEGLFENPRSPLTSEERSELLSRLYSRRVEARDLVKKYDVPYRDKKLFNLSLAKFILDQEEARGEPLSPIFYEAYEQAVKWFPDDPFDLPETQKVWSFYMKQMTDLIPDYAYDYEQQTLHYAMLTVRNGTMYGVFLGLGNVPFFTIHYLESRALMEGVSKYEIDKIREQEEQRQIELMIDILEDRPVQEAMEAWREEAEEGIYENPTLHFHTKDMTCEQKQAMFAAQSKLHEAGIDFDTGYAFDSGVRDWQWDWSLDGPVSVTIHDREWLDARSPKVSLREMAEDWPEKRKRKKKKTKKRER